MQPKASERLKLIRKQTGGLSQQKLADVLSIPISRIKDVESGKNNITVDLALRLEGISNFCFKWIMTGQGGQYNDIPPFDNSPAAGRSVELQHIDLVKGFADKQRAMNLVGELIELEKLDPENFNRVESYIKGTVDAVKAVAKRKAPHCIERRVAQRRTMDDPDQMPDGLDRRSGLDRRVASG